MTEQRYRRAAGALIGMMFGFGYTLVSQLINRLALPGIPLYQPPLGPVGNILLGLLAGAGLGLLCAWPASAAKGILLGGAAAAAAVFAFTLLRMGAGAASTLVGLVLSAPMAWVSVLGMAVVRWLVDRQVEARRESAPLLRRLRLPLILTGVLALAAAFVLFSADARLELRRTHDMIQAGLAAQRQRLAARAAAGAQRHEASRPGGLPTRSNGRTSSWIASSSCARRRVMTSRPR